jgi:hypothetical protein
MAETSFAKRFVGTEAEEERAWRNGFSGDNSGGLTPFCLSLRSKDGRVMEGPSWSLFTWHGWMDTGGPVEKLVLLFSVGGIYIEGLHMRKQVESLLEEGKLKRIQEHDKTEIEAIRAHNLDKRKSEDKEPVVLRIVVAPSIKHRLEIEEHLGIIVAALKGEENETGESGNTQ